MLFGRYPGIRPFQLTGPQGKVIAWAPGTTLQFDLSSIPLTSGDKANYVPAIALTFYGSVAATDGGGTPTADDIVANLFTSFEIQGAWHGRPLAAQHVRGVTLPLIEAIGLGDSFPSKRQLLGTTMSSGQFFRYTRYLPLAHLQGDNPLYTAQLALLFKDAQLLLNTGANGVAAPSGANALTFANVSVLASAVLVPNKRILLAPGSEWLDLQSAAQTGSDEVILQSLGNATALQGIEPGAGIDTILALTSLFGQGGCFQIEDLTQIGAPFLDVTQTQHLDPFVDMMTAAFATDRPREGDTFAATTGAPSGAIINDFTGFPYLITSNGRPNSLAGAALLAAGARALALQIASRDLQLTKIRTFEGTQAFYRTMVAGQAVRSATNHTLIHQFKSWTPAAVEDFRQLVITSGLAASVLNTRDIVPRAKRNEAGGAIDLAKGRFFPLEYVPNTVAAK